MVPMMDRFMIQLCHLIGPGVWRTSGPTDGRVGRMNAQIGCTRRPVNLSLLLRPCEAHRACAGLYTESWRKKSVNERPCSSRAKSLISRCILIPQKIARPIHAFSLSGLHFEDHKRIWLQHFCGEARAAAQAGSCPSACDHTRTSVFFSACHLLAISAKVGCTSRARLCWSGGIETLLKVRVGCCLPLWAWVTSSQKNFPLYTTCTHVKAQTLRARHTQLQFYDRTESSKWIVL